MWLVRTTRRGLAGLSNLECLRVDLRHDPAIGALGVQWWRDQCRSVRPEDGDHSFHSDTSCPLSGSAYIHGHENYVVCNMGIKGLFDHLKLVGVYKTVRLENGTLTCLGRR